MESKTLVSMGAVFLTLLIEMKQLHTAFHVVFSSFFWNIIYSLGDCQESSFKPYIFKCVFF